MAGLSVTHRYAFLPSSSCRSISVTEKCKYEGALGEGSHGSCQENCGATSKNHIYKQNSSFGGDVRLAVPVGGPARGGNCSKYRLLWAGGGAVVHQGAPEMGFREERLLRGQAERCCLCVCVLAAWQLPEHRETHRKHLPGLQRHRGVFPGAGPGGEAVRPAAERVEQQVETSGGLQ